MNRETFNLHEQNILLRNKQKKAEMMRLREQERRTTKGRESIIKKSSIEG